VQKTDPIFDLIQSEKERQANQINLIASENIVSAAVRKAVGSELMHKYSEGNIGARYYEGNQFIDQVEALAIARAKQLFQLPETWDVNVQALSGSYANLASLLAVLETGDTIMSMYLPDGGHLSHGWSYEKGVGPDPVTLTCPPKQKKIHVTAKLFNIVQYATDPKTYLLDYDKIAAAALKYQPKMLITGGTSYPRNIDYVRMRQIADSVGALYLADVAHEAGLIAAGVLRSPIGIADIVTMTTHKTLRCARGAMIMARSDIIAKVNKAVLPGLQGGPFNNNIAGIAVGLSEALQPEFKDYAAQVLLNAKALADELVNLGFKVITGGTDKHLVLLDVTPLGIDGKVAASKLAAAGIIVNMNTIPWDTNPPSRPSGIRLGTPFITTQGMIQADMRAVAGKIKQVLVD